MLKRIVAIAIILITLLTMSSIAFAHEIYPPYVLSWYYRTSTNQAYLKVNQDLLVETPYIQRDDVDFARSRWNSNSGGRVVANLASFSTATVCVATPSEPFWISLVGDFYKYQYVAMTQIVNLNGTYINASNVSYSNPNINFSAIYVSPYNSTWDNYSETRVRGILAHELGHSLTIGHCAPADAFLMNQYASTQALYPTLHEVNDVNIKYP
jgi:hypothetical protein